LPTRTVDEEIDRPLRKIEELDEGLRLEGAVFLEPKHQSVHPEQARQLYLDIATMHQRVCSPELN
jgi:hypothetical protein